MEHALTQWPLECCGYITGPRVSNRVNLVHPCQNIQAQLQSFASTEVRGAEQAFQMHDRDRQKFEVSLTGNYPAKVIYHSHTQGTALFSRTDQLAACLDGKPLYPVDWLVVAVSQGKVLDAAQFGWHRKRKCYALITWLTINSVICDE